MGTASAVSTRHLLAVSALTDATRLARESWPKPLGLAFAWIAITLAGLSLSAIAPVIALWAIILAIGIAFTVLWFLNRSLKRCPKDKFGFVIAISVDDPATQKIFDRDFCKNLESLLVQGPLRKKLWVYQVPQFHLPHALTLDQATKLGSQTKSHFLLFGQVRTRQENTKKYYLDLDGLVSHSETNDHNKTKLRGEFREVLPKRTIVDAGSELPEFELRSSLSSVAAKYIVGIAASISGRLDYADTMFHDAYNLAVPLQHTQPLAKKIVERLPYRLTETLLARARLHYERWRETYSEEDFRELATILNSAPVEAQQVGEWKALSAICFVVETNENWIKVENLVSSCDAKDPTTHVNLAFIRSVTGDLRGATRHYRAAHDLNVNLDTVDEIMSFLLWYKDYRPKYIAEIFFDLGFIAYCLLRDYALAKEYFDCFDDCRANLYVRESELAKKWLSEIALEAVKKSGD